MKKVSIHSSDARPWQGDALAAIFVIGACSAFLFAAYGLFDLILKGQDLDVSLILIFFFIVSATLYIFMAKACLKGSKWSPIASGVISIFMIVGVIGRETVLENIDSAFVIIGAFSLYCAVVCVKHPFFKKT